MMHLEKLQLETVTTKQGKEVIQYRYTEYLPFKFWTPFRTKQPKWKEDSILAKASNASDSGLTQEIKHMLD